MKGHISTSCPTPENSIRDAVRARVKQNSESPYAVMDTLYA